MKDKRRENRLAALALCLALIAAFSLSGLALVGTFGRAKIVPAGSAARSTQASKTAAYWGGSEPEIDPTEIYERASRQTVMVEIAREDDPEVFQMYGAGFLITWDGYIITNCHVVSNAVDLNLAVQVRTFDDHVYPTMIIGADQETDIALLKVKDREYFEAATLGNSELIKPCQQVYIMGHPSDDLRFTMTSGIISALGRTISFSDGTVLDMFQLDAAVNFGNSGGPVYNSQGEVIGITTAKYATFYSEGLGFAIPINSAVEIGEDLREYGFVRGRPLMGITVRNYRDGEQELLESPDGVMIFEVIEGLCGDRAGLKPGDVILSINDQRVTSTAELLEAKKPYRAGDTISMELWRNGETITTELTFDEVTPEHPTGTFPMEDFEEESGEEPGEPEPEEEPED